MTITTLTGDKLEVEVTAEDKVKDIKVSIRVRSRKNIQLYSGFISFLERTNIFIAGTVAPYRAHHQRHASNPCTGDNAK